MKPGVSWATLEWVDALGRQTSCMLTCCQAREPCQRYLNTVHQYRHTTQTHNTQTTQKAGPCTAAFVSCCAAAAQHTQPAAAFELPGSAHDQCKHDSTHRPHLFPQACCPPERVMQARRVTLPYMPKHAPSNESTYTWDHSTTTTARLQTGRQHAASLLWTAGQPAGHALHRQPIHPHAYIQPVGVLSLCQNAHRAGNGNMEWGAWCITGCYCTLTTPF